MTRKQEQSGFLLIVLSLKRAPTMSDHFHRNLININSFRDGCLQDKSHRGDDVEAKTTKMWLDSILYSCLCNPERATLEDDLHLVELMLDRESSSMNYL